MDSHVLFSFVFLLKTRYDPVIHESLPACAAHRLHAPITRVNYHARLTVGLKRRFMLQSGKACCLNNLSEVPGVHRKSQAWFHTSVNPAR